MIQVFGDRGWIGSNFVMDADFCFILPKSREDYEVKSHEVINFISTVHNYNVYDNPHIDIDTNLTILVKLLESWRKFVKENGGVQTETCFNFISSWFCYGNEYPDPGYEKCKKAWNDMCGEEYYTDNGGAHETDQCNPKGFYSITKRSAEQLLISYCETYDLPYRILRLSNVIGPGDKKASKQKNALVYLIEEMRVDRDIELYEGGNFTRDYIDISDCVRAIEIVLKKGYKNEIYNIGSGRPYVFGNLIDYVHKKLHSNSKIQTIEQKAFHKKVQVLNFHMNIDKIENLGYKPLMSIEETLDTIIDQNK